MSEENKDQLDPQTYIVTEDYESDTKDVRSNSSAHATPP